jgi:hypothetical protein
MQGMLADGERTVAGMTAKPDDPDSPYPKIIRFSRIALTNQLQMLAAAPGKYAADSQPGSPNDRDRTARHSAHHSVRVHQRRLWEKTVNYARHTVLNIYDHGDTLLKCISGDGVPLYAHYTNARVMMEASASTRYVLDPAISYEQRVTRGAAILIESSDYELKRIAVQSAAVRAMWGDVNLDDSADGVSRAAYQGSSFSDDLSAPVLVVALARARGARAGVAVPLPRGDFSGCGDGAVLVSQGAAGPPGGSSRS